MNIPITKPSISKADKAAILKPFDTGWLVQGPYVEEFEIMFAKFTDSKAAIATTSCTSALHLSLVALGIKPGDKVICPSFTFVATANVIEQIGAIPIFCDISLDTFNLCTNNLKQILNITPNNQIKAIIAVSLFGLSADMIKINTIAAAHHLVVIEDAACAFDTWLNNKHSGTFGKLGCFSFHPRKAITTGEGGMIITQDLALAEQLKTLRNHGASTSDLTRHTSKTGSLLPPFEQAGFNYRMTDFQGALGLSQLNNATNIMNKRRYWANRYLQALSKQKSLILPSTPIGYRHAYQSFVCLYQGDNTGDIKNLDTDTIHQLNKKRNQIMIALNTSGIQTRQGTHAVHCLDYYQQRYQLKAMDFKQSYIAESLSISLPLFPDMTEKEFDIVVKNIKEHCP
jgi:perosamine synthetase